MGGWRIALTITAVTAFAFAAGSAAATPQFEDVAESVGIDFYYWGEGDESTPTLILGGGACWGDFDGDGFDDLFMTKSRLPTEALNELHDPRAQMFRNNGDGTFTDVSAGSGTAVMSWGMGCSVADYDSDGDLDLFYSSWGESTLFRNDGPFRFTNVTATANASTVGLCLPFGCMSTGSAWGDVNADGCLDLYIANYGNSTATNPIEPIDYDGQANLYYENRCDGTFRERTLELNLDDDPGPNHSRTFMPMFFDHNDDGRPDIYTTSDGTVNSLLEQQPDGTFLDVAAALGVDDPRAGMGLEVDDVDGDGLEDLYMTHYGGQHNGFYVGVAGGGFRDRSGEGDLAADIPDIGWGTAFADFDNDGLKDIYSVNGHTQFFEFQSMTRRLWLQNENGTFRHVTSAAGTGITMLSTARGGAVSDYDFDGDLDILVENVANESANLLRASNVSGNWLEIQLRDPTSRNNFAVGATVSVEPHGLARAQHRILHAGASFLSQNSLTLHFGLGASNAADVTIRWPDGGVTTHADVGANRVVRVTRGVADLEEDVLAPVTTAIVAGTERGGWYAGSPFVSLSASDRGVTRLSGVTYLEYAVDGAAPAEYSAPFSIGEGEHVLRYRATDAAGNVEPWRELVVRVDATRPVTALSVDAPSVGGWLTALPIVTASATDTLSGVDLIETRVDGGAWVAYTGPFLLDVPDGPRDVDARATDVAGIVSEVVGVEFLLDARPPSTSVRVASGPYLDRGDVTDVTSDTRLALASDDAAGSGVAAVRFRVDGGAWRDYDAPFAFSGPDRDVFLEFGAVDAVGHTEPTRSRWFFLDDARPPEVRPVAPVAGRLYVGDAKDAATSPDLDFAVVAGTVTVVADAGQDVSGVAWMRVLVDGVERHRVGTDRIEWAWDSTTESPGWHELTFEAADGRGNVESVPVRVLVVGGGLA